MIDWDPFEIRAAEFKEGQINRPTTGEALIENWPMENSVKEFLGLRLGRKRLLGFFLIMNMALSVIFYRAYTLQVVQGEHYRQIAEGNRIRVISVKAARGLIYDRQNRPLVKNTPGFNLSVTPSDLPIDPATREKLFEEVAQALDEANIDEFKRELNEKIAQTKKNNSLIIRENLDYTKALVLKVRSSGWPGVSLEIEMVRNYANSQDLSLSHILGYMSRVTEQDLLDKNSGYQLTDRLGKAGLEQYYEKILKGVDGREQIEVDALGKTKKLLAKENSRSGSDLILSIDQEIQEKLSSIFSDQLKAINKTRGVAVALDPNNGEILGAISLPSFDNNLFANGISRQEYQNLANDLDLPLFNRLISGEYPSGSTFKPIVAAAALNEGLININTVIKSVGGIRVNLFFFPDWKAGGHGYTNVTKAIAESVNSFFYMVGGGFQDFKGLGVNKIVRYAKLFGLGKSLGVDLNGEKDGFLPTPEWKERAKNERWYIGDTYHLSIGQGDLLVTPLQLAAATAAFANNGIVYKPHFVKELKSADQQIEIAPEVINKNFVSQESLNVVRQGLRETVAYGSARSLNGIGATAGGKTGTAQWHSEKSNHAWFTGFAPYNKPEIVITVLIEEGGEGGAVSVPVAREFLSWYFNSYKKEAPKLTTAFKNVDKPLD